jgi:hypothetical protein
MRAWRRLSRLVQRGARAARRAARNAAPAARQLAERLAYRPREVVVVALLAGGLSSGLAVERWRARHPAIAERLEAEPPRRMPPAAIASTSRPRPRSVAPRCDAPGTGSRDRPAGSTSSPPPRLDLNRATPRQLARLAGISWGLAARIIAARDALEQPQLSPAPEPLGRGPDPGARSRRPWRPAESRLSIPFRAGSPDPEPLDGPADPPPE